MQAAVVDAAGVVANIIVADAAKDAAPEGCVLIALTLDQPCGIGWLYDSARGVFTAPDPVAE